MNYFKPNWRAINKAIESWGENNSLVDLRKEQNRISKLIQKKVDDHNKKKAETKKLNHIKNIRALAPGSELYFKGTYENLKHLFGSTCIKKTDGRKYITVIFATSSMWRIPYSDVQTEPLTQDQLTSGRVRLRITEVWNDVLRKNQHGSEEIVKVN